MQTFFEPDLKLSDLHCQRNDTVHFLHDQLEVCIRQSGHPGEYLIPNKILADRLKIAPQTLRKVYRLLAEDHLICRDEGKRLWRLNVKVGHIPCLGLILPTSFSVYFPPLSSYGQCHFRMYTGLVERAAELGYSVFPVQLPPPDSDYQSCVKALADMKRSFQGVIHLGGRGTPYDTPLKLLSECESMPQVSLDCVFECSHISSVSFDAQQAIHLFVESMVELGHQRLAFIRLGGSTDKCPLLSYTLTQSEEIFKFFQNEGIASDRLTIVDYDCKSWLEYRQAIGELLSREVPPTAFFCRNDDIAIELMQIIREEGFRVPEDFSVVGFNDLNEAATASPPLSTICNPLVKLGSALADELHHQIQHRGTSPLSAVRISPMYIPRGSTGPYLKNFYNH